MKKYQILIVGNVKLVSDIIFTGDYFLRDRFDSDRGYCYLLQRVPFWKRGEDTVKLP